MSLQSRTFRLIFCLVIGLIFAVLINEISFIYIGSGATRVAKTIDFVIPAGTKLNIQEKKATSILPSNLKFVLGDTFVIHNQDSADHQFGNLFIPSGTSATIVFNEVNSFTYQCSFEPQNFFGFEVTEPLTSSVRLYGIFIAGIPFGVMLFIYSIAAFPFKKPEDHEA